MSFYGTSDFIYSPLPSVILNRTEPKVTKCQSVLTGILFVFTNIVNDYVIADVVTGVTVINL